MSKQQSPEQLKRLEDDPLWNEANALAAYFYDKLGDFPEEEKWHTQSKLHNAAADFIFWMGLSLSNVSTSGQEHDWAYARKYIGALKTVYRFAGRQKFVELDPEIMVRLDKLMAQVDKRIQQAYVKSEEFRTTEAEKDLKPWLKKYEIWRKLNNGKETDA